MWITGIQRINSDSYISRIEEETITSDSFILEVQPEGITSDAEIKATYDITIDSDAMIKATYTPLPTQSSNSFIKANYTETLNSDAEIKAEGEEGINSDAMIKVTYPETLTSDAYIHISEEEVSIASDSTIETSSSRINKTATNEIAEITSPSNMKFTPDQTILFKSFWIKCKGGDAGTDGEIKLTCNGVDSNTVNIGVSSGSFKYYKFTFTSPILIQGTTETTITITETAGSMIVKTGSTDSSGWNVEVNP
jgi:hypothetical protein